MLTTVLAAGAAFIVGHKFGTRIIKTVQFRTPRVSPIIRCPACSYAQPFHKQSCPYISKER